MARSRAQLEYGLAISVMALPAALPGGMVTWERGEGLSIAHDAGGGMQQRRSKFESRAGRHGMYWVGRRNMGMDGKKGQQWSTQILGK